MRETVIYKGCFLPVLSIREVTEIERSRLAMNEIQNFTNNKFGQVRAIEINNEPWFVGKDISEALGYENASKAIRDHVDEEDKKVGVQNVTPFVIDSLGRKQHPTFINESGLYSLILSSKLSTAKAFKRWVTSEVIPSIRKHGAYMTEETLEKALLNPDGLIKILTALKSEQAKAKALKEETARQKQLIGELKPKADYTDKILSSKGTVPITAIAKDYGMSGRAMNKVLADLKIIYQMAGQWLLYSRYQAKGYTHSKSFAFNHADGRPDVKMTTEWTQKGRLFLYQKLKKHGILPMIEQ